MCRVGTGLITMGATRADSLASTTNRLGDHRYALVHHAAWYGCRHRCCIEDTKSSLRQATERRNPHHLRNWSLRLGHRTRDNVALARSCFRHALPVAGAARSPRGLVPTTRVPVPNAAEPAEKPLPARNFEGTTVAPVDRDPTSGGSPRRGPGLPCVAGWDLTHDLRVMSCFPAAARWCSIVPTTWG